MVSPVLENVPLFAFATAMEFSKVFPEDSSKFESLNTLIPLSGPFRGCFACILGVGILDFSAGLSRLFFVCEQTNIKISAVINVGICGAYPGRGLSLLDVVNVSSDRVGDLGCEEHDGSYSVWSKSVPGAPCSLAPTFLQNTFRKLPQVKGATVNCCVGTAATAEERVKNLDCDVESMEGAACFAVCEKFNIPAFQIRAVSNIASTRDKSLWKIDEALEKLHQLFAFRGGLGARV